MFITNAFVVTVFGNFLFVGAEFREKVYLVGIYQVSHCWYYLLTMALSFLALGYLLDIHYLRFAKFRAVIFLGQLKFQTLPQFFFLFVLPHQSVLEKLFKEKLSPCLWQESWPLSEEPPT